MLVASVALCGAAHRDALGQEGEDSPSRTDREDGSPAQLAVILRSEAGEPVRGATVRIEWERSAAQAPEAPRLELRERPDGRYSAAVEPGRYALAIKALGYEDERRQVDVGARGSEVMVVLRIRPVAVSDIVATVSGAGGGAVPGHATSDIPLDGGIRTLSQRLSEEPGVQVRSSAGGGEVGTVRGSRPEGLLVLLDGLPVNDPLTGSADLSRIPVATLAGATLVRGASPRFGSGATAGVLLLQSRTPDGLSAAGGMEIGTYGRLAADGYLSLAGRPGTLALGFRVESVQNDFEYANRTLPERPTEVRENADRQDLHLWLSGAPSGLPLFTQIRYDEIERGAPGRMGTHVFDEARYEDRSFQAVLGYGSRAARVSGTVAQRDLVYRDPGNGMETDQSLASLRLAGSTLVPGISLDLSGYLSREVVEGSETVDGPSRWSGGVWLGRTFAAGRLAIQPGIATDVSTHGNAVSPTLALGAQIGRAWALWGRAGSAYRLPTFADLYAPSARGIRANPDLQPERVVLDAEAGARWSSGASGEGAARGGIDVQASAFYRRTKDPIVWVASAVALWSPQNLDRLTAAGLEVRADAPIGSNGPRAGGSFTLQRSRLGFGTNTNPMPYQPDIAADAYVSGELVGVWLRGAATFVGSRTTTLAGTRRLPAYTLVRLEASRGFPIGAVAMDVVVAVENLLDVRYETIELFPEPGRSLLVRLEIRR